MQPPPPSVRIDDRAQDTNEQCVNSPQVNGTIKFTNDGDYTPSSYDGIYKDQTEKLIKQNWSAIKTFSLHRKVTKIYNIRVENNDLKSTLDSELALSIFFDQTTKYKINAAIGFILSHRYEEKLRYFHASCGSDRLLDKPTLIECLLDHKQFLETLKDKQFLANASKSRDNSQWSVHKITNITFFLYLIRDHVLM